MVRNLRRSRLRSTRRARRHAIAVRPSYLRTPSNIGFTYVTTLDDVIASRGGIPLVEGGKIIGAVGCSGGTGSQDEAICMAASGTINKTQ